MKSLLYQLKLRPIYFISLFAFLVLSLIICLRFSKQDSFRLANFYHCSFMDSFFINCTMAGDGLTSIVAVILLVIYNKRKEAVTLLIAYLSSGLVAQILKHLFNFPRPKLYLEEAMIQYQYFVEGVVLHSQSSFPSGHTTSAFAMATVFALCFNDKRVGAGALLFAILTGYSRVYLAEHFVEDVVAGAIIGVLFAMLSYFVIWQQPPFNLTKVFRKKRYSF